MKTVSHIRTSQLVNKSTCLSKFVKEGSEAEFKHAKNSWLFNAPQSTVTSHHKEITFRKTHFVAGQ